jgi:hypothetical protein
VINVAEFEQRNLIAAGVILADLAKYGEQSGLHQWAALVMGKVKARFAPPESPPPAEPNEVWERLKRGTNGHMSRRELFEEFEQQSRS